jgi:hypothetical protein
MALAKPRPSRSVVAATMRRLLREGRAGKTICPSDVARAIAPGDFRPLMPLVRQAAGELVAAREIVVLQKGKVVDLDRARGPIRLATAPSSKA